MKNNITIGFLAAVSLIFASMAGCESMGKQHQKTASDMLAAEERGVAEGAKARSGDERPRGAWSSEAADIEKSLTRRSADPNW